MRKLAPIVATNAVANALLLWLGYYWLGLGETRAATLAWSALVALVAIALECWLLGATLAFFGGKRGLGEALRTALRRLAPLVAAAILLLAVYAALGALADYSSQPAFKIASFLTLTFKKPVKPASMQKVLDILLWLVRWMVVPALALPMVSAIASDGWRGMRLRMRRWWYWIATPVLLVCSLWAPIRLMGWTPVTSGFGLEMVSFVIRLLIAYLLFVGSWMTLEFLTSGGRPRATQPSTVVSP